jgi:hypothetical protein
MVYPTPLTIYKLTLRSVSQGAGGLLIFGVPER